MENVANTASLRREHAVRISIWTGMGITNIRKLTDSWRANNCPLDEKCFKTEMRKGISNFLDLSVNENTICPSLWDTTKVVPRH